MFHLKSSNARLEMVLRPDELIATEVTAPVLVTCASGSLWLTARDTGDILISSRQTVVVRGPGRLVMQALTPSRVEISDVARADAA